MTTGCDESADRPRSLHEQTHGGGPMLYLPAPSWLSVAVGNVNVGPKPQMNRPGFAGERKSVGLRSPMPKALSVPGKSEGWLMMGMMVRVISPGGGDSGKQAGKREHCGQEQGQPRAHGDLS